MGLLDNIANAKKEEEQKATVATPAPESKAEAKTPAPKATGMQSLLQRTISNAGKAPEGEFSDLPKGKYRVVISEAVIEKSKSGYDMFKIEGTVNGESHPDFKNQKVWDYIMLEFKPDDKGNQPDWVLRNAQRFITTLKKFGAEVTTEEGLVAGITAMNNVEAFLEVKITKNNDKTKNDGEDYRNYSWTPIK